MGEKLCDSTIESLLVARGAKMASEVGVSHVGIECLGIEISLGTELAEGMATALVSSRNHRARGGVDMLTQLSGSHECLFTSEKRPVCEA